jgi:hypothetical protein
LQGIRKDHFEILQPFHHWRRSYIMCPDRWFG